MPAKGKNHVIESGATILLDVSTSKHPSAICVIDAADLSAVVDRGRWLAWQPKPSHPRLYVRCRNVLLHRFLLGMTEKEKQVDHRNGDGLDNRRANLRRASNAQNASNGRSHGGSTSQFRGVSWDKERGRWAGSLGINGKRRSLGRFDAEEDAARAYDKAAFAAYGEFARLNFGADHVK